MQSRTSRKILKRTQKTIEGQNIVTDKDKETTTTPKLKVTPKAHQMNMHSLFKNHLEVKIVTRYRTVGTGIFIQIHGEYYTIMEQ